MILPVLLLGAAAAVVPAAAQAPLPAPAKPVRITGLAMVPGEVVVRAEAGAGEAGWGAAGPTGARAFALAAPLRLVIDLPASVAAPLVAAGAGRVKAVRVGNFSAGVARLVLDLSEPLEIVSASAGRDGLTVRLRRVDAGAFAAAVARGRRPLAIGTEAAGVGGFVLPEGLFGGTREAAAAAAGAGAIAPPAMAPTVPSSPPPPAVADAAGVEPAPPRTRPRARTGNARPLVVIDAGHGGKDVGAISVTGGYEKEVTLAIARATARALERGGRVRVKLTRGDDRFIPLGGRVAIARAARADLFISIHADAAPNALARGASVYTLSAVASDAVAERLAARENKADIIGGVNLGVDAPDVADIMIDLSRRATTNVSVAFAETLQAALSDRTGFRGQFHRFAGFRVLKAPDVPSVLLETGYVTNSDDARFLFSDSGRKAVAEGIARAVERHLTVD